MASITTTNICNRALGRCGEGQILDISDAGAPARACQLHFDGTRDEVLRSHRWNFATARASLSMLAEDPPFYWKHQYALPGDFIRALEVNGTEEGYGRPWKIEGKNLLTNEEDGLNLVYIRRATEVDEWDSLFQEAMVLKLAAKLSVVLRGSSTQVDGFLQEYAAITAPLARRVDANEGRESAGMKPLRSEFVNARRWGN